jgi:hypothetical protein
MPLLLRQVDPPRGLRWIRDAFALYARRPLAFTLMFVSFLGAALLISIVPIVGGVVQMMSLPLLTLGFMVASQSALLDGPVTPRQFIEPLRGDPARRRSLLILCVIYGLTAIAILLLSDAISGNAMLRMQQLVASGNSKPEDMEAILMEPQVGIAFIVGGTLAALLSVPFWHAPALVYWGAQGVAQALFSSTLAMWRSKGAFLLYGLVWIAISIGCAFVITLLLETDATRSIGALVILPTLLLFQTVFYVSLLFTFNDSFGGTQGSPAA